MNNQPVLRAYGVSKKFKHGASSVSVLKDISIEMNKGDFVAIMGPSGSGKSTLLHILSGLLSPDSGKVTINGNEITGMPDLALTKFRRRNIGLVFQDFNLIPTLSAEENILLPMLLDGTSVEPEYINRLLEQLSISARRTHRPNELSGGECQRVAIGRALIANPSVIFADEPTGNLDSHNSNNFCELLSKLNKADNRTILLVTHNPAVAAWCNRVHFLKDGEVLGTLDNTAEPSGSRIAEHYLVLLNATEHVR